MPELPEVETIRSDLEKNILNKNIKTVSVFLQKSVLNNKNFSKTLSGLKIKQVKRRGKLLIFYLSNNKFLIVHLRMTGQLIYGKKINPEKYTRVLISFIDDSVLLFNDLRTFGYLKIIDQKELDKILKKYGIEPGTDNFKFKNFKDLFKSSKGIKQILLDQNKIAGIGNIYADESCFEAGILPQRKSNSLNEEEIKRLFVACEKIIMKAVKMRGTSFSDYRDIGGHKGNYLKLLCVYGQSQKKCIKCNNIIIKKKMFGRGTHYCSICQR